MKFFSSDGVDVAYVDLPAEEPDRDEPILLIHGFASNHRVNWIDPRWATTLTRDRRRVVAFDNRGHGRSAKLYDPAAYATERMARDAANLLDHLEIERADVMGYSMGARIGAFLALAQPARVRSLVLGGLGGHLVDSAGLPLGVAEALEAPSLAVLTDPMQRLFRSFAESAGGDLRALAACIRGSREALAPDDLARIFCPVLVAVGDRDPIAGDPRRLAQHLPDAEVLDIPGRDHNLAVGDKAFKSGVLAFLARRP